MNRGARSPPRLEETMKDSPRQPPQGTRPANTSNLALWPPELGDKFLLF